MTAIRLADGTIIYGHSKRYENGWELHKPYSPNWKSRFLVEGIKIHDDAIETVLHVLRGGKEREEKNVKREKNRNEPPSSA